MSRDTLTHTPQTLNTTKQHTVMSRYAATSARRNYQYGRTNDVRALSVCVSVFVSVCLCVCVCLFV